jgi:hypothetical protein
LRKPSGSREAPRLADTIHGTNCWRERLNPMTCSDSCAKIRDLGFAASMHVKMYGERFEIVSDPFDEGDCISVRAISRKDSVVRTLRLPIAILVGLADRFLKPPGLIGESPHSLGVLPDAPFATGALTTPLTETTII